jgi:hypothetical protein
MVSCSRLRSARSSAFTASTPPRTCFFENRHFQCSAWPSAKATFTPGRPSRSPSGQFHLVAGGTQVDALVRDKMAIVVPVTKDPGESELALVVEARNGGGAFPGLAQRRQQHSRQDRDDGDHNQEFDEGEKGAPRVVQLEACGAAGPGGGWRPAKSSSARIANASSRFKRRALIVARPTAVRATMRTSSQ